MAEELPVEDLPIVEDVVVELPADEVAVEDVVEELPVEDLPIVEDVVDELPVDEVAVEDVVEELPVDEVVVEDVVEELPGEGLLQPLPAELTDELTDELFDRLTADVIVDEPREPTGDQTDPARTDFAPALVPEGVAEFETDEPVVFRIGGDQYDPFT